MKFLLALLLCLGFGNAARAADVISTTTFSWDPEITDGSAVAFNTATQNFDPTAANAISFSGDGYFINDPGQLWYIVALTDKASVGLYCSLCTPTDVDQILLSDLGAIHLPTMFTVVGIQFETNDPSSPGIFRNFGGEGVNLLTLAGIPEPRTWMMMLVGFGGIGFSLRRRSRLLS